MRNMENLFSRIQSLNLDTYKSLSISFNNTIQKMAKMDLHLWSQLQIAFSAASERNRPAVIREFLVLRGRLFVTTSFDYTHAPNLQANQLCVELARKVIKPGEALCQLLMPTISRVYGTHFMPEDVEPATSESEDDPFLWENYLTHVDGRSLIYVPGLYEISARNPDFLFSPKPELLALSVEDHERVRTVAGIASERYFEKLKEMFLITHNETNCVGNALRDLQRALVASSKQSSGSEFEASMIHLRRPVLDFYKIWVALSALQKNKIASYEGRSGTRSLESYLLFLFLHAKSFFSEIHVSQDQYQRVIRESIFPCADLVSQSLDDILKTHLDLFEMPLPGSKSLLQQDVLPTSGQLELMQDTLKTAVLSRSSIGGLNDVHCSALFPLVKALSSHFLNMASVAKINALIGVTKKVEDVAVVLNFLRSPGQQASYLRRICFSSGYFFFNTPRAVIIMVNRLSEENWRSFFETMNKIMPGLELVQSDLIYILNSVPKKQWSELIRVMHPCLVSIFSKNDAIASLFADMFYHQFTIDQTYELFRDALDAVLSKLRYITALLQYSDSAVWPALMQILKTLFAQHCKNKEFEVSVLQQLNLDEEKIQFLRALYSTLSNKITMTPLKIAAVMNLLSFESCKEFLNLLDANHFQYVKTANELAAFLKLLINPKRQLAFIQKIYDLHIPLEATIKNFYYLVRKFPENRRYFISCFGKNIPRWIREMILEAKNSTENSIKLSEAKFIFNFFINHILFDVFSYEGLSQHCPSLVDTSSELIRRMTDKMASTYSDTSISQLQQCFCVMAMLQEFLKSTLEAHIAMNSAAFAQELQDYVGENFFDDLFYHTNFVMISKKIVGEFQASAITPRVQSASSSQFFRHPNTPRTQTPRSISFQRTR